MVCDGHAGTPKCDGFGSFNPSIDAFDGFTHTATEVVVKLTDNSGTWATAADVLAANVNGSTAAIHGFACSTSGAGCTSSTGAYATGYASNGTEIEEVPESSPFFSFLAGAGGLLAVGFRRYRMASVAF